MDKHYLIELIVALFGITEGWDKDELLGLKLRNLAGEILESFILISAENPGMEVRSRLLSLENEFENALVEARRQRIIERRAFIFLKQEYEKVRRAAKSVHEPWRIRAESLNRAESETPLEKKSREYSQKENLQKRALSGLNQRQEKIVELLAEKKEAQVSELKEFFPKVSKRTVRRDIDALLERDLIVRRGKWNDVFYTLA